jgi:tetratricopeptide (TPR) repeat protein
MRSLGFRLGVAVLAGSLTLSSMDLTSPSPLRAQEDSSATDEEARGLFAAGRAAFADGRYEDARSHFQRSYELSGRPQLLYNLGQAEDRLRHDEAALAWLERYLAEVPDAANRVEVQARIEALRAAVARTRVPTEEREASAESTPGAAPAEPGPSAPIPVATIVLSALALGATGAAVGTWVGANDAYGAADRDCAAVGCSEGTVSSIATLVDATNGLWVSALVLGAGAAIALPLELTMGGSDGVRARLALRPGGLSLGGTF